MLGGRTPDTVPTPGSGIPGVLPGLRVEGEGQGPPVIIPQDVTGCEIYVHTCVHTHTLWCAVAERREP